MKHWLETRQVAAALAAAHQRGVAAALATVVRVSGSAYRHEGAKLLVTADGITVGNVSGGCLELDVRELALQVIESGTAAQRTWCGSLDPVNAWDLGVGCAGEVEILVEPVERAWPLVRGLLDGDAAFAIVTRVDDVRGHLVVTQSTSAGSLGSTALEEQARTAIAAILDSGESQLMTFAEGACFVDILRPPPHLLLCGAGDDAAILANQACDLGFAVTVTDRRAGWLTPERFRPGVRLLHSAAPALPAQVLLSPRTYAVAMAHHYADDRDALSVLAASDVAYIGVLGPRARTERMLADLGLGGPELMRRLFAPVGLDIGTDGAEQVALSVLAEILAVRSGRAAASLRTRRVAIHATQ